MTLEFFIGLGIGVLGIIVTLLVAKFQNRKACVSVTAHPKKEGYSHTIICEIKNSGNKSASNILLGFNKYILVDTKIYASPEIGAKMIESDTLPDVNSFENESAFVKAFAIEIPLIAAQDKFSIKIETTDPDNLRASHQNQKIRGEVFEILNDFYERVKEKYPKIGTKLDVEIFKSYLIKNDNFFRPGQFSYEQGRFPIKYFTEEEKLAKATNRDIIKLFKRELGDVFLNRKEFIAPVVKFKSNKGEDTMAIFSPYVKTSLAIVIPRNKIVLGEKMIVSPPIPESYDSI
jgi:hypothetical protein